MKEIRVDGADDCLTQRSVQIELAFDISAVEQIYTPNPRWDTLTDAHDSYWDEVEEPPTQQQNSCDILDQEQCQFFGNYFGKLSNDLRYEIIFDFAPQHLRYVGAQFFKDDHPAAPQHSEDVGAQVILATKIDVSETSVGAQVKEDTQKSAPQHEKPAHWIEKYWVERAGNKHWYFRYRWMLGRKSNRIYLGSVRSRRAQEKVERVREAIAQGKSPWEIKQLIKAEYD